MEALIQVGLAHDGPVIVPMTVVDDAYFDEIMGGLRSREVDVRHYALIARPETLHRRLRRRLGYVSTVIGDETWATQQIPRCVAALSTDRYATHVPTDNLTVDEVVEWIADDVGLQLTRPRLRPFSSRLRRMIVGVRHVRV